MLLVLLSNSESSPAIQEKKAKQEIGLILPIVLCGVIWQVQQETILIKLLDNLQYNYNSGKITKDELRFGIRRLEKKYEHISFTQRPKDMC